MSETLAACEGVTRRFDLRGSEVTALEHVSCAVHAGDRIAVTGPSGSGKSTLLALIAQLDAPSAGKISWPGFISEAALRPRHIGLAFQSPSLIPALSTAENVEVPLLILNDAGDKRRKALEALDLVGLSHLADRLPEEISGGQAQRVALARAIVTSPQIIIADEPTGQLDQETGHALMEALITFSEKTGAALIVATHDETVAGQMNDIWRMSYGRLTAAKNKELAS
jgi:ABC-type lipoprotein export system ATPase subunit